MKRKIYQINSLNKLPLLAEEIVHSLKNFHVITMRGDLGAGKTTLTQALAKTLKIKNNITSPSFVLTKIYKLPKNNKFRYLYHLDLYRVPKKTNNNLDHVWQDEKSLIIVEWPEKLKNLPRQRVDIQIQIVHHDARRFTVRWLGIK